VADIFDQMERWLDDALTFWSVAGVDRKNGGFVEHLNLDGSDAHADFKRVRVMCRQIYVFSHAATLGRAGSLAIARHGYEFLTTHGWLGPDHGWARRLGRSGGVRDATPDLYDLAFALFALGWYGKASGDPDAWHRARETLTFINQHMRHPGDGFLAEKPARGPRLQNPHMHLLEAALVNLEFSGDRAFRELADEIVDIAAQRFINRNTWSLAEYYTDGLEPIAGDQGRITEPGHQFEWAWILANYQRLTGVDVTALACGLALSADKHGIALETGATYDLVRDDGRVLDRSSRTWPNAERIQAAVALFELTGRDPRGVIEQSATLLLTRHLAHTPRGTWIDHFDADWRPKIDKIPASTLYHVMIAFSEALRIRQSLTAQVWASKSPLTRLAPLPPETTVNNEQRAQTA
jgi:mannose/cellobiose epimerase-like protein (N-acyl-D-glucosamine 2-epimerase family)